MIFIKASRILYDVRHKECKTEEDELLLKHYKILANISEILVSESKWHISSDVAVKRIREVMQEL